MEERIMYITQKEYNIALNGYSFIDDAVKRFTEDYASEFCSDGWINQVDFDSEAGTIDIEEEHSYCGCCSNDYENYCLPIEYLWDKAWIDREKERRNEKIRKAERKKAEQEVERKKEREVARYQNYLTMKKEYEG